MKKVTNQFRTFLLTCCLLLAYGQMAQAAIKYVKPVASGTGDGSSWANASDDLQAMINAANSGDEVWVAAGTYKPTTGTDRTISFEMKNGVAILGGFPATGNPGIGDRDWTANVTTLSGDIGTIGNNGDNSINVIFNNDNGVDASAVLDGFTVTGGSAIDRYGGGMLNFSSSPTVANCSFSDNRADYGGGMANFFDSSPTITDCSFSGNRAAGEFGGCGGGMYNLESSPTITRCSFSGNRAAGEFGGCGGGMYNYSSSPTITDCSFSGNSALQVGGGMYNFNSSLSVTNCSFSGNSANNRGGGMYNLESSPTLTNCSFSGNSANDDGGGMYNEDSSPTLTNCILWGNGTEISGSTAPTVTYSIVQGGHPGTGNLNVNPLFVSQPPIGLGTSGDLHLQACSPAKDAGTAVGAPATDFDGDARPIGAGIDMGFDENGQGGIIYVNQTAAGANDGTSWTDAYTDLQDALDNICSNQAEIWVAAGTYKPTTGTDRTISFVMKNGVAILGGFPATGNPGIGDRDVAANVTTLSGDIGNMGDNSDNSYHVIFNKNNGLDNSAELNGFIITGGNANLGIAEMNGIGGGGGGMRNFNTSPSVVNCSFVGNYGVFGGAMSNSGASSPTVTNCSFSGNSSSFGGGMYNSIGSPTITNCTFSGNSGILDGGGVFNSLTASVTITNCIFWGNTTEIENFSLNGPINVTYSIVQGGYPGTGNLDVDPIFISQPPSALALQATYTLAPALLLRTWVLPQVPPPLTSMVMPALWALVSIWVLMKTVVTVARAEVLLM